MEERQRIADDLAKVIVPIVEKRMLVWKVSNGGGYYYASVDVILYCGTIIRDIDALFREIYDKLKEAYGDSYELDGIDLYVKSGRIAISFFKSV